MDQRYTFALEAIQPGANMTELCRSYGISKPTGYKWRERFLAEGSKGLYNRSRRPTKSPSELSESVVCELVKLKTHHPSWGPYKIRELYLRKHGQAPSDSSVKRVLEGAGLVRKRKRRAQKLSGRIHSGVQAQAPNDVWTVDFKGWWQLNNGSRCEPLTVRDEWSRFILEVRVLENSRSAQVRACFEQLFERHGLPLYIRSDNGPPFAAAHSVLGLSKLSVWWLALGIDLERGRPGNPQDNGAHERMHRDIKHELQCHAKGNAREQQAAFDIWRETFNTQRPHESLGKKTPTEVYQNSPRSWEGTPTDIEYPQMMTRRVHANGGIKLDGVSIQISSSLGGWSIGLLPTGTDRLEVYFAQLKLGEIDLQTYTFHRTTTGPIDAPNQNNIATQP